MIEDMTGRVAFVTGGSDGIGLTTARMLLRRGATVAVCGRNPAKLEAARTQFERFGRFEAHSLDVADDQALTALIEHIADRHGRLDMLVNNAMSLHFAPIASLSLDDWRKDFAVNADAAFVATKAAMAIMARQDMVGRQRGAIVNIASTCGIRAAPNMAAYSASKAALVHFTAAAAVEGASLGIRVNAIVPGQVQTAATRAYEQAAPELADATARAIPMQRGGEPEELAEAIVFMLSDAASYITGSALPVDGGKAAQLYLPT